MRKKTYFINVLSNGKDALFTAICKNTDLEYAKSVGRKLWSAASEPYHFWILDEEQNEIFRHKK